MAVSFSSYSVIAAAAEAPHQVALIDGERSWRYSVFIDDGVIKKAFIEPGFCDNSEPDPFEVSDAQTMLKYLQESANA